MSIRAITTDSGRMSVAEAAAPIGRATIRERVDTRSAIFERRAALESVGQSFKLEIEETKAVSYAADFMHNCHWKSVRRELYRSTWPFSRR